MLQVQVRVPLPVQVPSPLLADIRGRKLVVFEDGCGLNGVRALLAGAALTYAVVTASLRQSIHSQVQ